MADMNLTQSEADALIAMEKHCADEQQHAFPTLGQSLTVPLHSTDRREQFFLDISRGRIDLIRGKYQNRARQVLVLVRLDFGGAPHRNPDGEDIECPHLHVYREGFGDKWATRVPTEGFAESIDVWGMLGEFQRFCNITRPPRIERGLFL